MTSFPVRLTIIVFALSCTSVALAQTDKWYVAPSIVYNNDDGDRYIDDELSGVQINVGRHLTDYFSIEGTLGFSSITGEVDPFVTVPGETHIDIGLNLLAFYDREATFAPYALVGVGFLDNEIDSGASARGLSFKPGPSASSATTSIGLGFKWRMGQSKFSVTGEFRGRAAFDTVTLIDGVGTIGLQYNFGGRPGAHGDPSSTNIDTDGDGVLDMWDECPDSPRGVEVTSRGCELKNIDRDSDEDNVVDNIDECPNTPYGIPVDERGCSIDSDMDGVPTGKDRCPGSPIGADVDVYGCEHDEDRDGVPGHRDSCLDTRPGVRVDVYGCEIKDIITLPGVNFETGSDVLLTGTEYLLQNAADTLNKYPEMQIEVAGHSDDVGDADQNIGLSMRRAKTVRDFLIGYGVDESRLTFKGYGEAEPIADNGTADGRATNRRVELRLVTN